MSTAMVSEAVVGQALGCDAIRAWLVGLAGGVPEGSLRRELSRAVEFTEFLLGEVERLSATGSSGQLTQDVAERVVARAVHESLAPSVDPDYVFSDGVPAWSWYLDIGRHVVAELVRAAQ